MVVSEKYILAWIIPSTMTTKTKTSKTFGTTDQAKSPTAPSVADKTFVDDGSEKVTTPPSPKPTAAPTNKASPDESTKASDDTEEIKNPHLAWHTSA